MLPGHSGLDPWFDVLTTLSAVEGESSVFSSCCAPGCPPHLGAGQDPIVRHEDRKLGASMNDEVVW
jgi:hypothetical protein